MHRSLTLPALAAVALIGLALPALADTIAGVWWTPDHDGKIAIEIDDNGVVGGRLIAVSPEDAQAVDDNNPDTKLRFRPLIGLPILQGFTPNAADGALTGGSIYDPETGKTYYGSLTLTQDGKLAMRASVAFNLFWRTEVLERVDGDAPATQQPGEPTLAYSVPAPEASETPGTDGTPGTNGMGGTEAQPAQ
jgi:uncharacterized protein (DUF2147 family)